jgi:hypothetical protein
MTSANKLFILQSKQWIGRVQKFGMKNDFDTIMNCIEQITATNSNKGERIKTVVN